MNLRSRQSAGTLVELLVVVVIIGILAGVLLPRYLRGGADAATKRVLAPKQRAQQTAGIAYVQQVQQAIQMYKLDNEDRLPRSLEELKRYGITDEMLIDPVTKQPLDYNPQTGQVGSASLPPGVSAAQQLLRN